MSTLWWPELPNGSCPVNHFWTGPEHSNGFMGLIDHNAALGSHPPSAVYPGAARSRSSRYDARRHHNGHPHGLGHRRLRVRLRLDPANLSDRRSGIPWCGTRMRGASPSRLRDRPQNKKSEIGTASSGTSHLRISSSASNREAPDGSVPTMRGSCNGNLASDTSGRAKYRYGRRHVCWDWNSIVISMTTAAPSGKTSSALTIDFLG
jgi:hypothetical protein